MTDQQAYRFRTWRLPLVIALAGLMSSLLLVIWSPDFGVLGALCLVTPIAAVILVFLAARRRGRQLLIAMAIIAFYGLMSWGLTQKSLEVRFEARWIFGSNGFKTEVMAQPAPSNATLRHVLWDYWGFSFASTNVYLVFDPGDSLRGYSPKHLNDLPCEVWKVTRLEKDWYAVTFYTDTDWDSCHDAVNFRFHPLNRLMLNSPA